MIWVTINYDVIKIELHCIISWNTGPSRGFLGPATALLEAYFTFRISKFFARIFSLSKFNIYYNFSCRHIQKLLICTTIKPMIINNCQEINKLLQGTKHQTCHHDHENDSRNCPKLRYKIVALKEGSISFCLFVSEVFDHVRKVHFPCNFSVHIKFR